VEKATVSKEGVSCKSSSPYFIRFRPDVLLNYSNTKLWMSVVVDCYEFIKDHIQESSSIIFDNGCLNNSFKAILEEYNQPTLNVLSADVKLYSECYFGRYFSPVEFLHDGRTLPLVSGKIDVVTSNYVLEHVSDPHKYLQEIHRVLKREGLLFISVPTPRWFIAYFLRNFWYLYPNHLKNDFKQVIRHPVRDFLAYNAHEKDWNKEKEGKITFIDGLERWKIKNWEDLYLHNGFRVIEKKMFGNAFSLAGKKFFLNRPLFNFVFYGNSCVYILMKY
jgi:SAM-dependent methyltransferase